MPSSAIEPALGSQAGRPIAVVGTTVLTMIPDTPRLEDATVLVRDGRIVAMGPSDRIDVPGNALRIDGRGRFLMPGLADMHVHLEHFEDPVVLGLFVANGVTTVRNMDGRPRILDWRRRVAAGELPGPRIVTAGPILDGDPPLRDDNTMIADADAARSAVHRQHQAGYDFVKVYTNLSPGPYRAVIETADELGMAVTGHLPRGIDLRTALEAGQDSIEHLDGYDELIEAEDSPFRDGWHWSKRFLAMPAAADLMDAAAELTARHRTWNVPTLVQPEQLGSEAEMHEGLDDPTAAYVPAAVRASWNPDNWPDPERDLVRYMDQETRALLDRGRVNRLALVRALHEAGAGLLPGTDTPNPLVVPGFSLHRELELLAEAGLPAGAVLRAATRASAEFLAPPAVPPAGGTVAVGRRADLILLAADPTVDIAHTRQIDGVIHNGAWLPRSDLDALLRAARDAYSAER